MATRSTISVVREDGSVLSTYCHWDGYFAHNGHILSRNYNDRDSALQLIKKGKMSSLSENIDNVVYYADRGETGVEPVVYDSVSDWHYRGHHEKYNYILIDGQWWVLTDRENNEEIVKDLRSEHIK